MKGYMTDEELLEFIEGIEKCEMVEAPPGINEAVFQRLDNKNKVIEYKRFRNRVIAAVAVMVVLITFSPDWTTLRPAALSDLGNSHYISELLNAREE